MQAKANDEGGFDPKPTVQELKDLRKAQGHLALLAKLDVEDAENAHTSLTAVIARLNCNGDG